MRVVQFLESVDWLLVSVLVLLASVILIVLIMIVGIHPPHERYQAVYNDCIMDESMTAEQCEKIALAVIRRN